ncbi:DMT family transporter [Vibrio methylphosphonaticus]|uniref:DMT family transporter n=1 Tax=Vibrio methylphosphonaticus TaxID=2946866 RepID=UPI00202AB10A|nr:DMT family transporter [Vibrio methylphosphonaticus]MCL9775770.1 DMT family transporter [Vibrio methylphosphonaticus]
MANRDTMHNSNSSIQQANVSNHQHDEAPKRDALIGTANVACESLPTKKLLTGILLALLGAALFSIKPILIKIAYQYGGDTTSIMSLRAFSSLPFYLVVFVFLCRDKERRKKVRSHGLNAAALGVLGYYGASYLDIEALSYISAQLERLLLFLFPSFVVLISWLWLKQKPSANVLKSVMIGYAGITLIVVHDVTSLGSDVWRGSALAVSSALAFACYLVLSKPVISQLGSTAFTSIGMGSAGLAILVHLQWSDTDVTQWSIELVSLGLALGVVCTVIPSYLMAGAMARLTATEFSLTANVGPVITAIAAVTVLGESFTIFHALGMLLVIISVYWMTKPKSE